MGVPVCPAAPTGEVKFCVTTLAQTQLLSSLLNAGGSNGGLVQGPATSFTFPLVDTGPATCAIVLQRNGQPCVPVLNPCADGYLNVALTSPGSVAVLSCSASGGSLFGLGVVGGAGSCQPQADGTVLQIPCGGSAGPASASATPVQTYTCAAVLFSISSVLTGCLSGPTSTTSCPLGGSSSLGAGTATVTVSFASTSGAGGQAGGIVLGQNSFTFTPPSIGALLVTATPQAVPSNGTTASVVTATFACGDQSLGTSLSSSGFPTSATGFPQNILGPLVALNRLVQPVLGATDLAACGASLPGTFSFASPGPVLFDDGRVTESVSCGLPATDNLFGGGGGVFGSGNSGFGLLANPTLPLAFTCTGAAVLAIGAGDSGDAPINVTYQSQVGGLQAVGSTLITVAPSGVPRLNVQCSPGSVTLTGQGSVCTTTVTDENGTPLTGLTGATVTFALSDTTAATILPCVETVAGGISVSPPPVILPQIAPVSPCLVPSGTVPVQAFTFINGQASAVLVPSPNAHPETVTVTATLGVLIPPMYACEVSPYVPTSRVGPILSALLGLGTYNSGTPSLPSTGAPGTAGCGTGNPVGLTGFASALSTASEGLTGIVTMPNTTSAATTVSLIAPPPPATTPTPAPSPAILVGTPSPTPPSGSPAAPAPVPVAPGGSPTSTPGSSLPSPVVFRVPDLIRALARRAGL